MQEGENQVSLQLYTGMSTSSKQGSPSLARSILERGCSVLLAFSNK